MGNQNHFILVQSSKNNSKIHDLRYELLEHPSWWSDFWSFWVQRSSQRLGASKHWEVLGSRIKEELVVVWYIFSWQRKRGKEFILYFSQEGPLVFCNNILGVLSAFNTDYFRDDQGFFIEPPIKSLKAQWKQVFWMLWHFKTKRE